MPLAPPSSAPSFAVRSNRTEIMDDLNGTGPDWHQALRELKVINHYLGGNSVTIEGLERLLKGRRVFDEPLEIADIGCGGGDMLQLMADWARANEIPVRLTGVDANPHIIEYARQHCRHYREIDFMTADIFSDSFAGRKFDLITSTLFTHHFTDEQLVSMMKKLHRQAHLGLVINDLHRHPVAYYSIKLLTKLASRSYMVKHDAPVSVLRAFSRKDWEQILQKAGLNNYRISWRWAFRWMLTVGS